MLLVVPLLPRARPESGLISRRYRGVLILRGVEGTQARAAAHASLSQAFTTWPDGAGTGGCSGSGSGGLPGRPVAAHAGEGAPSCVCAREARLSVSPPRGVETGFPEALESMMLIRYQGRLVGFVGDPV
jgi:hypothetical protein